MDEKENIINKDIEDLLTCNKVKKGWKDLILGNRYTPNGVLNSVMSTDDLKHKLHSIMQELYRKEKAYYPKKDFILKAFAYAEPSDTKVIIIGKDPVKGDIEGKDNATGLSFSMECSESSVQPDQDGLYTGYSIWKMHEVLRKCGLLVKEKNYSCDHEEWAKRGVLLLNAALTIGIPADSDGTSGFPSDDQGCHMNLWSPFVTRLLEKLILDQKKSNNRIFVMLWGSDAYRVWKDATNYIQDDLQSFHVMMARHPAARDIWDTYMDEVVPHFNMINQTYPGIFSLGILSGAAGGSDESNAASVSSTSTTLEIHQSGFRTPTKRSANNMASAIANEPPLKAAKCDDKSNLTRRALFADEDHITSNERPKTYVFEPLEKEKVADENEHSKDLLLETDSENSSVSSLTVSGNADSLTKSSPMNEQSQNRFNLSGSLELLKNADSYFNQD